MAKTQSQIVASAIRKFAINADNCCDMSDRKESVQILADEIGVENANKIAEAVITAIFGRCDSYYLAK